MAEDLGSGGRYRPPGSCGDLHERVMRIGQLHRKRSFAILASEVHGLKLAARAWRFDVVEGLAHSLEAELAMTGPAAMVAAYVGLMDDAIDCDETGPAVTEAMLATVRARLLY